MCWSLCLQCCVFSFQTSYFFKGTNVFCTKATSASLPAAQVSACLLVPVWLVIFQGPRGGLLLAVRTEQTIPADARTESQHTAFTVTSFSSVSVFPTRWDIISNIEMLPDSAATQTHNNHCLQVPGLVPGRLLNHDACSPHNNTVRQTSPLQLYIQENGGSETQRRGGNCSWSWVISGRVLMFQWCVALSFPFVLSLKQLKFDWLLDLDPAYLSFPLNQRLWNLCYLTGFVPGAGEGGEQSRHILTEWS